MAELLTCRRFGRALLAAGAGIPLVGPFVGNPALAVDTTWTNASGTGSWNDPANWTNGIPSATDRAWIAAPAAITLSSSPPATALDVNRSFSTLNPAITLTGGRLITPLVSNFGGAGLFTVASPVESPGTDLVLRDIVQAGPIGTESGGGTFGILATFSRILAPSTASGEVNLFGTRLEEQGSFANAVQVTFANIGTITPSAATAGVNRLPDNGAFRLAGSSLFYTAPSGASVSESTGTLSLLNGRSALNLSGSEAPDSLVITSQGLTRASGTVLHLNANSTARLRFISAPTGPQQALGFGVATLSDGGTERLSFLAYDAGANGGDINDDPGLRPLNWNTEYNTSLAAGGNVKLVGDSSQGASASVDTLNLADGSLQLTNGAVLNVARGMILQGTAASAGIGGTGAVNFPGEAPVFTHDGSQPFVLDVPVTAQSLLKAGSGALVVNQPLTVSGGVAVADGTLTSRVAGGLGSATVSISNGTVVVENVSQTVSYLRLQTTYVPAPPGQLINLGTGQAALQVGAGSTLTVLGGAGGDANKTGPGTLVIPSGSTVPAAISVIEGELHLDGQLGNVGITGGKLSGTGRASSITKAGTRAAVIAPGPEIGSLTADNWSFSFAGPATTLEFDLAGASPGQYDQLRALNFLDLRNVVYAIEVNYAANLGDTLVLFDKVPVGAISPVPSNLPEGAIFSSDGYQFQITYQGGTGNDVAVTIVPEPAAATAIFGTSALALLARRRRDCK